MEVYIERWEGKYKAREIYRKVGKFNEMESIDIERY